MENQRPKHGWKRYKKYELCKHSRSGKVYRYHQVLSRTVTCFSCQHGPVEHENIRKSITIFLETHPRFSFKYSTLAFKNKKWVVDYLSGGKGVIPYEMIKQWEDLNITPTLNEKFFAKTAFYGSLKNSIITDQEYEDVQKLFWLIRSFRSKCLI